MKHNLQSATVVKLEFGVSRQPRRTIGVSRQRHLRADTSNVVSLFAPCCQPCQTVRAGGVVYHRQSDEAWPVAKVTRTGRHLLITFRAPDNPAKQYKDYPACNQFMAEPPSGNVRVLLPLAGTYFQPLTRPYNAQHRLFAMRRDAATDYARGDLVFFRVRGQTLARPCGYIVALGATIAINDDLDDPDCLECVDEYRAAEVEFTGRELRANECIQGGA